VKLHTITSPNNALAVAIYAMLSFSGLCMILSVMKTVTITAWLGDPLSDMWATLLFISSSAAVYATLSAPKRRDPDTSLIIELWSCISLCTLMILLELSVLLYRSPSGAFLATSFGFGLIFLVAFGFRAKQIKKERKALHDFRNGPKP